MTHSRDSSNSHTFLRCQLTAWFTLSLRCLCPGSAEMCSVSSSCLKRALPSLQGWEKPSLLQERRRRGEEPLTGPICKVFRTMPPGQTLMRRSIPGPQLPRVQTWSLNIKRSTNAQCRGRTMIAFPWCGWAKIEGTVQQADAFLKLLNHWYHLPRERKTSAVSPTPSPHANLPEKLGRTTGKAPAPKLCHRQLTFRDMNDLHTENDLPRGTHSLDFWNHQSFLHVTGSTIKVDATDHTSHHPHGPKLDARCHGLSPDHYNTLLSGLPASTLDPKYHSWRGLIFKAAWEVCSYAFGHGLLRLFSF